MSPNVHATKIADALVGPWLAVDDETEVAIVFDASVDVAPGRKLFARYDYTEASEVARLNDATLVKRETLEKIRLAARAILEPYTLPADALMASLERCLKHDAEIWRNLVTLGLTAEDLVLGQGKHHLFGAPKGRCYLMGWWTKTLEKHTATRRGPGWVQQGATSGPGPHLASQRDYATTTILERKRRSFGRRMVGGLTSAVSWLVGGLRSTVPTVSTAPPKAPMPPIPNTSGFASPDDLAMVDSWKPDGEGAPMPVVSWIVVHTAECAETSKSAENVAAFLVSRQDASCHFVVDNDSIVQQRSVTRQAGAAPGSNHAAIHIELAGYAAQTPEQWADSYSEAMLDRTATLVAALCERFNLPVEFVDADGLKLNARGITTHAAVSKAFKKSTHTDPGKNFPMVGFLDAVRSKMGEPPDEAA
jgi:hypothetical protein